VAASGTSKGAGLAPDLEYVSELMFVSSGFELSGRVNHWFAQVSTFPHLADMLRTPARLPMLWGCTAMSFAEISDIQKRTEFAALSPTP
jgi:hypothetical protein